jgi:hypothetical protein
MFGRKSALQIGEELHEAVFGNGVDYHGVLVYRSSSTYKKGLQAEVNELKAEVAKLKAIVAEVTNTVYKDNK